MKVSAVIPARLDSTRLPGKVMLPIQGRAMLWWVWTRASRAIEDVYIATDSDTVRQAASNWGANVLMTPADCRSGTERIVSVLERIPGELVMNIQADEPLLEPATLNLLVQAAAENVADIVTPVFRAPAVPFPWYLVRIESKVKSEIHPRSAHVSIESRMHYCLTCANRGPGGAFRLVSESLRIDDATNDACPSFWTKQNSPQIDIITKNLV